MDVRNPNAPNSDILAVITVDPDTLLPKFSYTNADVSLGAVPGVSAFYIAGVKAAVSAVTPEVIQTRARTLAAMAGVPMAIVSSSAADVGVVIRINALGPNGVLVPPFNVSLNGLTSIAIGTLSRINSLTRVSGDIAGVVTVNNGADVHGFMEIGAQAMQSASFTIPAGYRLVVQTVIAAMLKATGSDAGVTFDLRVKPMASAVFGPIISLACYRAGNSQIQVDQAYGGGTAGPVDIQVVGQASTTGCDAQAYVSGILVDQSIQS